MTPTTMPAQAQQAVTIRVLRAEETAMSLSAARPIRVFLLNRLTTATTMQPEKAAKLTLRPIISTTTRKISGIMWYRRESTDFAAGTSSGGIVPRFFLTASKWIMSQREA